MSAFTVKFWGTRGSIPAPGKDTAGYGGNTTSLQVVCGDRQFAIDGGTGVRMYGDTLMRQLPVDMDVLMTHLHLDHVQGFPFFSPFLLKGNRFRVWSARHNGHTVIDVLKMLFAQPAFPVTMEMLQSDISFHEITPGQTLDFGDVRVKTALLRHPGGVTGYRFEYQGKVFVHCSDWEHPDDRSLDPVLIDLARDADVLSIDATYTEDEYAGRSGPSRKGWGHATHEEALRHGLAAGAKQVLLFHHEQSRTDEALDRIGHGLFSGQPARFVREGDVVTL